MDISTRLNLSYAAVQTTPLVTDKTPVSPPVIPAPVPVSASDTDTNKSKDSNSDKGDQALKAAVDQIEKFVQSVRRNLEFSIDEASGKVVVKVIASETGEVVRQLPSAEALKIADSLQNAHSLLFDAKV
ncbi:flagellar protein FlaG [Pseudomonas sp. NPDC088368]|jgi:flagellar protein FlaG|uniref:flagellar protein FlaG n=1 Tax=Pseudomonas sp. NPDC088368 TaxID=3364453 RepID=UPI003820DAA4